MIRIENNNKQKVVDFLPNTYDHCVGQQEITSNQKGFWLNEFSEEISVLELPADFKRPSIKGYESGSVKFELTHDEREKLKSISDEEGSPMYIVLLSIYTILLSKLSNQEDIIVGMPVTVSKQANGENKKDEHVNILALRNCPKGELNFREFLSLLIVRTLTCLNNKSYPYEDLIKELKLEPDISRNPLFDVMFLYQNTDEPEPGISELGFQPYSCGQGIAKFDLTLSVDLTLLVTETDGKLYLTFEYSTELFKKETIERFLSYFKKIISSISDSIHKKISDIEMIPENEKNQILIEFNNTKAELPRDKTIVDLFEDWVTKAPNNTALIFGETTLSYRELNDKADRIASYLQKKHGIEKEDLVGLMLDREEYLIPSILGILKAGAAYVPIDPNYPAERKNSIITDSKLKVLITRRQYQSILDITPKIIDLDKELIDINTYQRKVHHVKLSGNNLAYIIYTSGSTGKPKGVMISHQSTINYIYSQKNTFGIVEEDRILQFSSICFDPSVEQIFLALLSGASLVLISKEIVADKVMFNNFITQHRITHLHATASFLGNVDLPENNCIKRIVSGAEECKAEVANKFCNKYKFYNKYGPTETTISSVEYQVTKKLSGTEKVHVGKPMYNTQVYILDKNMQIVPIGVKGEVYISGMGLARGYLFNQELTEKRFIPNPFIPNERMYKTGDLAYWLPDGNIEFVGRIDYQVKIRGYRIELGDIESHLANHKKIKESIVLAKEKEGDKYLVAYYVSDIEIPVSELRSFLSEKLPEYMVPSFYIRLEKIPLTPNGKMDRKALPNPELKKDDEYVAPSNEIEEKIAEIWSVTLGIDKELISVNYNFFMLGGNSLNAIRTVQKLKESIPEISTNDIFAHPTIKELASLYSKKHAHEIEKYNNVVEIEYKLKETFDIEAQLIQYKLSNNKDLIVLFLNKTIIANKKSFITFIETKLDDAYQPHYIIENNQMTSLNDQERVIAMKEKAFFRFIHKMRLSVLL
jgi:bacitracin synthase 3